MDDTIRQMGYNEYMAISRKVAHSTNLSQNVLKYRFVPIVFPTIVTLLTREACMSLTYADWSPTVSNRPHETFVMDWYAGANWPSAALIKAPMETEAALQCEM